MCEGLASLGLRTILTENASFVTYSDLRDNLIFEATEEEDWDTCDLR
jgi:hypothetical protein